ncbi:MAG: GatB/YqeY domain-containing protein, partial [Nitrososphaeria archaeon]
VEEAVRALGLAATPIEGDLERRVREIIGRNPRAVEDARRNPRAVDYLVGMVLKETGRGVSARAVADIIRRMLEEQPAAR